MERKTIDQFPEYIEARDKYLKALREEFKLKINANKIIKMICKHVKDNAEELEKEFVNIAPYGKYKFLMEDRESKVKFLKEDCSKADTWALIGVRKSPKDEFLVEAKFVSLAVDNADNLHGYVFLNNKSKVLHVFAHSEEF